MAKTKAEEFRFSSSDQKMISLEIAQMLGAPMTAEQLRIAMNRGDSPLKQIISAYALSLARELYIKQIDYLRGLFEERRHHIRHRRGDDIEYSVEPQREKIKEGTDILDTYYEDLNREMLERMEREAKMNDEFRGLILKQFEDWQALQENHAEEICALLTKEELMDASPEFIKALKEQYRTQIFDIDQDLMERHKVHSTATPQLKAVLSLYAKHHRKMEQENPEKTRPPLESQMTKLMKSKLLNALLDQQGHRNWELLEAQAESLQGFKSRYRDILKEQQEIVEKLDGLTAKISHLARSYDRVLGPEGTAAVTPTAETPARELPTFNIE